MTSSSIPAGSNGQPIFEGLTFDDKDVNAKGPIKITIASSDYRSLNLFRSALEKNAITVDNKKPSLKKYSIDKPFNDPIMSAVELLTIPLQSVSTKKFEDWNDFRGAALNFVYVNKSDDQLSDVFLNNIEEMGFHKTTFLFEQLLNPVDIVKYKAKISKFISTPVSFVEGILFGVEDTVTKIKTIILNRDNLESLEGLQILSEDKPPINLELKILRREDREKLPKYLKNYSCHTGDIVHSLNRSSTRLHFTQILLKKFTEMLKTNDDFIKFNRIFSNNSYYDLSFKVLCDLKAYEIEKSLFEKVNGSLEEYKNTYADSNKIYNLCFFSEELPEIELTGLLGKRAREDFERQECKKIIKNQLLKSFEDQLIQLFDKIDFSLTLKQHIEQKVIRIEDAMYRVAKNNLKKYYSICMNKEVILKKNGFGNDHNLLTLGDETKPFLKKSRIPVPRESTSDPVYKWFYSGLANPLVEAMQSSRPAICYGPVDENGDDILEKRYRNSENRKVEMKLPGIYKVGEVQKIKLDLDKKTLCYNGTTIKGLARKIYFKDQIIEVPSLIEEPSFWNEFQDTMIEVKDLDLNELPPFEIGTAREKKYFVDIVNKEIVKIHPGATVKSVRKIQNFEQLHSFQLKQSLMEFYNDAEKNLRIMLEKAKKDYRETVVEFEKLKNSSKQYNIENTKELQKKIDRLQNDINKFQAELMVNEKLGEGGAFHEAPYFFFHGSIEAEPSEVINEGFSLCRTPFDPNKNWGKGIDLSSSFLYAHQGAHGYYDPKQEVIVKYVYVGAANLGYSKTSPYDPSLVRPPQRALFNEMPVGYDSIEGRYTTPNLKTDVHVVYDTDQVIPLLVICYTVPVKKA